MRLIDHHEVPARIYDRAESQPVVLSDALGIPASAGAYGLDRVEGADDLVERPPGIEPRVDGQPFGPDTDELLAESVGQFGDPLELDALGRDDQGPAYEATCLELGEDGRRRDCLSEADLV